MVLLILRRHKHTEHGIEFQTKQVANMSNKSIDLLLLPFRSHSNNNNNKQIGACARVYNTNEVTLWTDGVDLSGTRNGFYHANLSIMLTLPAFPFHIFFVGFLHTHYSRFAGLVIWSQKNSGKINQRRMEKRLELEGL